MVGRFDAASQARSSSAGPPTDSTFSMNSSPASYCLSLASRPMSFCTSRIMGLPCWRRWSRTRLKRSALGMRSAPARFMVTSP